MLGCCDATARKFVLGVVNVADAPNVRYFEFGDLYCVLGVAGSWNGPVPVVVPRYSVVGVGGRYGALTVDCNVGVVCGIRQLTEVPVADGVALESPPIWRGCI